VLKSNKSEWGRLEEACARRRE